MACAAVYPIQRPSMSYAVRTEKLAGMPVTPAYFLKREVKGGYFRSTAEESVERRDNEGNAASRCAKVERC